MADRNLCYRALLCCSFLLVLALPLVAQENNGGQISGNLETNANFFVRDSLIGAANTPQYDRQLYGAEAWLNLNYSNWGFDFGLRFDLFNNSNLLNPTGSYTDEGIGRWYISKSIQKLDISVGYLYDQIGSGIIFRAFEERPLLIDNALFGARLGYEILPDWKIKVFTGRQKQQFDLYGAVIKGLSVDGYLSGGEGANWAIAPGFGVVNRTLDDASMNSLVATINTYTKEDAFVPKYNAYAFSAFNTLTAGDFTWYVEGAYKSKDNLNDPFGEFNVGDTTTLVGDKLFLASGSVVYSSVSYANKGLGITLEGKRTENFDFRTRPQEQLNRGLINFLPPMARVNTYRLNARYNAATQTLGEQAFQADIRYNYKRKLGFNVNFSNINTLDKENSLLYREVYTEISYKHKRTWTLLGGVQSQRYNQEVFEFKPDAPIVETVIPYFDFLYKFDRKKSIRFEGQYMATGKDEKGVKHDYGNWLFGLVEFSIAPHWTFTVSDMYNADPGKNSPADADTGEKLRLHYPRFDVFYSQRANRFSLSYIKQVEGVVCTGGICRLEPAFSGVRFTANSSF
ncbi:MAG: hypothetical protein H6557_12765 [Lewinellaceae bacterium]|nr:hypothetical protein [Phaeodactylibacter sp.]MCB9037481.1 hypothetical protein [Lewinellaceae bacterium]